MEVLLVVMLAIGFLVLLFWLRTIGNLEGQIREIRAEQSRLRQAVDWLVYQATSRQAPPAPQPQADQPPEPEPAARRTDRLKHVFAEPEPAEGTWKCPSCNGDNDPSQKYCVHCGIQLAGAVETERPAPTAPRSIFTQQMNMEWWTQFEQVIGIRWMTWVGVLILIAAASFAVKYMFDIGLLGPWVRVLLEFALGLLICYLGRHAIRHRMPALGQGLLGLGLAVFYVSLYAAYHFHQLLSPQLTIFGVAVIAAAGLLLALRYNALAVATLATLGGLLTPELVSQGSDIQHVLFSYILVLDLAVLAVALFKRWRLLDVIAFLGTLILVAGWGDTYYSPSLLTPTLIWLCAFYLIFLLMPFIYGLRLRQPLQVEQFLLAIANATALLVASYYLLLPAHRAEMGLLALLMGACYVVLAGGLKLRLPADERTHYGLLALAIFCITLAVPLLLKFNAITIVWALEAPLLVLLGHYFGNRLVRAAGPIVLAVALLRVLVVHWPLHDGAFTLFVNSQFGTVAFIPLAAAAIALLHHVFRGRCDEADRSVKVAGAISGGLLAILFVNLEIGDWFALQWAGTAAGRHYVSMPTHMLTCMLGAALFMVAGVFWRSRAARWVAMLLLLVPVGFGIWAYLGELSHAAHEPASYLLFYNYRFLAGLLAVLVLMGLGWLHTAHAGQMPEEEQTLPTWLGIGGGLLLLLLLSGEFSYWLYIGGADLGTWQITSLGWQALIWAAGAVAFLAAGVRLHSRAARFTCLAAGAVSLLLVLRAYAEGSGLFFGSADSALLFLNVRFAAGLLLVAALCAYGLMIRRRAYTDGEQQRATSAYVGADILLLCLLSAEVYGFYNARAVLGQPYAELASTAMSVVWGIYALAFIAAGFWLKKRVMRLWALGLFGLTAFKLLVFDLSHLEPKYRLVSSVILGLLMLGTSFIYHRVERQLAAPEDADGAEEADGAVEVDRSTGM